MHPILKAAVDAAHQDMAEDIQKGVVNSVVNSVRMARLRRRNRNENLLGGSLVDAALNADHLKGMMNDARQQRHARLTGGASKDRGYLELGERIRRNRFQESWTADRGRR